MKILIADDDQISRALLADILTSAQAGYTLVLVEDGQKAWAALEENDDVKLAIIDLQMPGVTGIDLLERIRADARFATLPVIVCTASTDRATVANVAARGVSNFLVKPLTRTTVLEKVWQICRPAAVGLPVLRDLGTARQRLEIDRDTHRELLAHFVRVADMWAADARRATEYSRVRALAIRATNLKQQFGSLGAAALTGRFLEAEEALSSYRTKPLANDLPGCVRKAQQLGERVQQETDRLREMLDTIV